MSRETYSSFVDDLDAVAEHVAEELVHDLKAVQAVISAVGRPFNAENKTLEQRLAEFDAVNTPEGMFQLIENGVAQVTAGLGELRPELFKQVRVYDIVINELGHAFGELQREALKKQEPDQFVEDDMAEDGEFDEMLFEIEEEYPEEVDA